jgi:hypothetical protein
VDDQHLQEVFGAVRGAGDIDAYLEKYIYSVADDREMLEKRVGAERLSELRERAVIKDGYQP